MMENIHYLDIADTLNRQRRAYFTMPPDEDGAYVAAAGMHRLICQSLADRFNGKDASFDRRIFLTACGVTE